MPRAASAWSSTSTIRAETRQGARTLIRNAVIHILNEQPVQADLFEVPASGDVSLVCTNLRTMNGSRPVFADHIESVFVFPFAHIRFVEMPPTAMGLPEIAPPASKEPEPEPEPELELDEDLMRRIRDV